MATLSPLLKQATPVMVDHAAGSWIHARTASNTSTSPPASA